MYTALASRHRHSQSISPVILMKSKAPITAKHHKIDYLKIQLFSFAFLNFEVKEAIVGFFVGSLLSCHLHNN